MVDEQGEPEDSGEGREQTEEPVLKIKKHYAAVHLSSMDFLLREAYEESLNRMLNNSLTGYFPEPPPLTRWQKFKKKWKRFWDHIPDFINFVKEYEYEEWRYWDRGY